MKKYIIVILLLLIVAAGATFFLTQYDSIQKKKIEELTLNIAELKAEHVPILFKIVERTDSGMQVVVKFFDAEDNELTRKEYSLRGKELSFDFQVIPIDKSYLAFPYKIYSDQIAPVDGIDLIENYDKAGFPQVFYQSDLSVDNKRVLASIFEKVKAGKILDEKNTFGSVVHDFEGIKSFETGLIYKIVSRTKGGIEIIEE